MPCPGPARPCPAPLPGRPAGSPQRSATPASGRGAALGVQFRGRGAEARPGVGAAPPRSEERFPALADAPARSRPLRGPRAARPLPVPPPPPAPAPTLRTWHRRPLPAGRRDAHSLVTTDAPAARDAEAPRAVMT